LWRSKLTALGLALAYLVLGGCSPAGPPTAEQGTSERTIQAAPKTDFDGEQAFAMLKKQVSFGPRVPGSEAHGACLQWLVETLGGYTTHVEKQQFMGTNPGWKIPMYNVIARFNPDAEKQVVVCAHWDTRPTADEDLNPDNRSTAIDGANDGASGVAVLLELARVFSKRPPQIGVTLIFYDGEDIGPDITNMLLGSAHWALHQIPEKPAYGILLDMIGDKDLRVPVESYSLEMAKPIVKKVYGMAERLGMEETFPYVEGLMISDDHVAMNQHGVPTIDLIDFTYPYWHTLKDTVDKCSAQSLQKVGTLVEAVLREEK
jgi:glutaminyl-peptide cyclotransferase